MPYQIRVQTTGTRLFSCVCGAIGRHKVSPQAHKLTCRTCHRVFVLGTIVYDVTPGGSAGKREPADAAISSTTEQTASPYSLPARASAAEETTVRGGIWRSGEPVTIEMPRELPQLWREHQSGELYIAASGAMGTRFVVQPIDAPDDYSQRTVLSAVEWKRACERIG